MKRFLLLFLLIFTVISAAAQSQQQISVESFRRLDTDMDARVTAPKKDQNGDVCAIIKVVTPQSGFSFNVGLMGVTATEQKSGEIWVYVPQKVNRITISHPQLGVLRDYYFNVAIAEATCYELRLITGNITQVVEEDAGGQYFAVNYSPNNIPLNLYIDDEFKATGTDGYVSVMLPYGDHTYRLESIGYNNNAGSMNIGTEKSQIDVTMVSSFGYVNIGADSYNGEDIDIYIDNELLGKAPVKSSAISAGEHTIQALSKYYLPYQTVVNIPDGEEIFYLNIELEPNFAQYTISTPDNDAKIYVNDEFMGTGSKVVRLSSGMNHVEIRKESHRTVSRTIEAKAGQIETLELTAPQPLYGTLQIESTPQGAEAYLDGESVGQTPLLLKNVLIGTRKVELKRDGYETLTNYAEVKQAKIITLKDSLKKFTTTSLYVTSTPKSARVYLDGTFVGNTPYSNPAVSQGTHTLELRISGYDNYSSSIYVNNSEPIIRNVAMKEIPTPTSSYRYAKPTKYKEKNTISSLMFGTLNFGYGSDTPSFDFGISLGYVKRWGVYVSYLGGGTDSDSSNDYYTKRTILNGGILYRPFEFMTLFGGVGYGSYLLYNNNSSSSYYGDAVDDSGISYEFGLLFKIKSFCLSTGLCCIGESYGSVYVGIGYAF